MLKNRWKQNLRWTAAMMLGVACSSSSSSTSSHGSDAGNDAGASPCTITWSGDATGSISCTAVVSIQGSNEALTLEDTGSGKQSFTYLNPSFQTNKTYGLGDVFATGECGYFEVGGKRYQAVDYECALLSGASLTLELSAFAKPTIGAPAGVAHGTANNVLLEYDDTKCTSGGDAPSCGLGNGRLDVRVTF